MSESKRVLLVEDNQANAESYLGVLRQNGFVVEHAVAAKEAIDQATVFGPDVVLLDLQIPSEGGRADEAVEHGLRTLDALIEADKFRPICIITAHEQGDLVRSVLQRTHGGQFIFKHDTEIRRSLVRAVNVALASPAYRMSKVVHEFRQLVEREEKEDVYRRFIAEHWPVILGPEYREVHSPYTITRGGAIDLLAVRQDGYSDLWELKCPGDPVFNSYNGWLHHSIQCARAIGQLMHYYDAAEKERPDVLGYEGRRGLALHLHRPRGFVVIGRYKDPQERERLRLENSFLAGLSVLTYDDLIERAEQFLVFLQSYRNGERRVLADGG